MAEGQPDPPSSLFQVLMAGVLVGFTWLANWVQGTEEGETFRRDIYTSKEDCLKDWGDEGNCEQDTSRRAGSANFYGPWYRSGQYGSSSDSKSAGTVDAPRPGSHASGTAHVTRGGFGGSGAAHSSSGS
jgi:hypothetical protein